MIQIEMKLRNDLDIRIQMNPLRDWKREVVMVQDTNKHYFRLRRKYRLTHLGEVKHECDTLKQVDVFLREAGLIKKR